MYLTSAIAHTGITPGAGTGLATLAQGGHAVSFEGSHDQAVVASLPWATTTSNTTSSATGTAVKATGNEARVLKMRGRVGDEGASSSTIAEMAGLSKQQAYRALRKLVDQGAIRRTGETRTTLYLPL